MFEQNSSKPAIVLNRRQTVIVPLKTTTIFNEIANKDVNVKTFAAEDCRESLEPVLGKVEDNFFVRQDKERKLQQQKQQQLRQESGG
jgi:hypothetical protein